MSPSWLYFNFLEKFKFDFFYSQLAFSIVKSVITFSYFVIVKHIFVEITGQHAASFSDAAAVTDLTIHLTL